MIILLFLHYNKSVYSSATGELINEYGISVEAERMTLGYLNNVINGKGVKNMVNAARREHKSWEFNNLSADTVQEFVNYELFTEDTVRFFTSHKQAGKSAARVKRIDGQMEFFIRTA